MRLEALEFIRCPACHGSLTAAAGQAGEEMDEGELKCAGCGHAWPVRSGMPHLVFPEELQGQDARSRKLWDRIARFYDWIAALTGVMQGVSGAEVQRDLIARLDLRSGCAVLETAAGTGSNLKVIAEQMGEQLTTFGLDLSPRTLTRAARRLRDFRPPPELVVGNTAHLPFADNVFHAVLDGYGTKYYSDKGRAIREMLRVVKPGGKVVITDLGLPPEKPRSFRQRLLLLWIPGFADGSPIDLIPDDVKELKLEWDAHETAYTIEFRKAGADTNP